MTAHLCVDHRRQVQAHPHRHSTHKHAHGHLHGSAAIRSTTRKKSGPKERATTKKSKGPHKERRLPARRLSHLCHQKEPVEARPTDRARRPHSRSPFREADRRRLWKDRSVPSITGSRGSRRSAIEPPQGNVDTESGPPGKKITRRVSAAGTRDAGLIERFCDAQSTRRLPGNARHTDPLPVRGG